MPFTFEKLIVYQKSVALAEEIFVATRRFPRDYLFLADQLNRAALSVAANIAEGNGRFSAADRRKFFGIARGSLLECLPLLEIATHREALSSSSHARLRSRLEEISRMLAGLIKSLAKPRIESGG
jgi:four helix bundle protein